MEAMGIRLLRGRWFTEQDSMEAPNVAIVSRGMARKYWAGEEALGKRVRVNRPGTPWLEVVGVVSDVNDFTDRTGPRETWYLPYAQHAEMAAASDVVLMVRSVNDPRAVEHSVRQSIHTINPDVAVYDVSALDSYYLDTLSHDRLMSVLISVLAGFGLLLGSLGIYGTLSFAVRERGREIGVRMALGATNRDILGLVMKHGMRLTLIAAACGLAFAWGVGRLLSSQLSEVTPGDPFVMACGAGLTLIVALLAMYFPARQASRLDPLSAMRTD
jgi:putative ABC transport system permease protein